MESFDLPIQSVVLVLTLVAGIKRHVPTVKGWKTVVIALVAAVALSYDYSLPAWAAPILTGLKVFAVTVGGHAYLSKLAEKFGVKLPPVLSTLLQVGEEEKPSIPATEPTKDGDEPSVPPVASDETDESDDDPKAPK